MKTRRGATNPERSSGQERTVKGWAWRGAILDGQQAALFTPGRILKHLGVATLGLGPPTDWPVQFVIYLHLGWHRGSRASLPSDSCFEVRAVTPIAEGQLCIALEQIGEGWKAYPGFRKGLDRWLRTFSQELPLPAEDERRDWLAPFACWLPQSRPGDAPLSGPLYEFEEAVRYAAAWSGVEEARVWEILAAHHRYLELAGIAEAETDEAQLREREEAKHWLPDPPECVDERAENYIAWATGHRFEDIQAADQGEMAYLDHLGLVTWDFEGERDDRLGMPHWELQPCRGFAM